MKEFDRIIGYTGIKKELEQISDTLKNQAIYDKLGVSSPKGLLLHGKPGVGKTLMADCLIAASGRAVFTCRKDEPNGKFVETIKNTFREAVNNAPSIVFLDDMDKFANGDERHRDAEEYVTVQSCMNSINDAEVFVLATANSLRSFPRSLLRAGRFDRVIRIDAPTGVDAERIIDHYLKTKTVVEGIDAGFIARVMDGHSCAELETVINEAGLYAGFERAERITMEHFIKAYIRTVIRAPFNDAEDDVDDDMDDDDNFDSSTNTAMSQVVYHEAGHAVVSEILCPQSVTIVTASNQHGKSNGFTSCYNDRSISQIKWNQSRIICALGGMAAVEQKTGVVDGGSNRDLDQAFALADDLVGNSCVCGFSLHANGYRDSEELKTRQGQAVASEIERYYRKAKEILSLNNAFFERLSSELAQKGLLSATDIQRIKAESGIVPVAL